MTSGVLFRIKLMTKQVFGNRFRLTLTIMGIFLSLLLFIGSYLVLDSIYYSKYTEIEFWKENNLLEIEFSTGHSAYAEDKERMIQTFGTNYLSIEYKNGALLEYPVRINGYDYRIAVSVYGTNNNFDASLRMKDGAVTVSSLCSGRGISEEDVENAASVILISETLEDVLYDGSAVGKILRVPYQETASIDGGVINTKVAYREFEIIGVYGVGEESDEFHGTEEMNFYASDVYVPFTTSCGEASQDSTCVYIYSGIVGDSEIRQLAMESPSLAIWNNYSTSRDRITEAYRDLRTLANVITIIILIMSAFMISQTMVFSVKERLPEYGIKRALGASGISIAVDLVLEVILYAVVAFLLAFVVAVLVVLTVMNVWADVPWFEGVQFVVRGKSILLAAMMSLTTSLLAVVFPLFYLDKKSIVETIRFE